MTYRGERGQHWRPADSAALPAAVIDGAPSDEAVEAYTSGACFVLAYHLHRLGGWPLYTVETEPAWWNHVVVGVPSGPTEPALFLDVEGLHSREELLERWGRGLPDATMLLTRLEDPCCFKRYMASLHLSPVDFRVTAEMVGSAYCRPLVTRAVAELLAARYSDTVPGEPAVSAAPVAVQAELELCGSSRCAGRR